MNRITEDVFANVGMTTNDLYKALQHYLGEDYFFEELVAVLDKDLRNYLDEIVRKYSTDYEELKDYVD